LVHSGSFEKHSSGLRSPPSPLSYWEGQCTIGIGDANELIEARDRVTHVWCIGQGLLTLFRKSEDRIEQFTLRPEPSLFS
jgi:hypothetical protein